MRRPLGRALRFGGLLRAAGTAPASTMERRKAKDVEEIDGGTAALGGLLATGCAPPSDEEANAGRETEPVAEPLLAADGYAEVAPFHYFGRGNECGLRLAAEPAGGLTTLVGGPGGRPALAACGRRVDSDEWVLVDAGIRRRGRNGSGSRATAPTGRRFGVRGRAGLVGGVGGRACSCDGCRRRSDWSGDDLDRRRMNLPSPYSGGWGERGSAGPTRPLGWPLRGSRRVRFGAYGPRD